MKQLLFALVLFTFGFAQAQKIKFNYPNEDIAKIIEVYSKATGQAFILDPGVRGRITILNSSEITLEEAFNQISTSLAIHGYAINRQEDVMIVRPARAAQRSLIDVSTQLPPLKPEKMSTWIVTIRNGTADDILRQYRNMTSKDGDINVNQRTNQLIITDWTSNLHRLAATIKQIDIPTEPSLAKYVEQAKKQDEVYRKQREAKQHELTPGFKTKEPIKEQ